MRKIAILCVALCMMASISAAPKPDDDDDDDDAVVGASPRAGADGNVPATIEKPPTVEAPPSQAKPSGIWPQLPHGDIHIPGAPNKDPAHFFGSIGENLDDALSTIGGWFPKWDKPSTSAGDWWRPHA